MEARVEGPGRAAVELLEAAERCLRKHGLAALSTRMVAEEAGMPLSQIHYHFGSKQKLLLALLEYQNTKLLRRQADMYARPMPLWQRWMQACDYLEEDIASGYVRVLLEMIAAGWSDPEIAAAVRKVLAGWYEVLRRVAKEAAERLQWPPGFTPEQVAAIVGNLFMGTESILLLGFAEDQIASQSALRKIGETLKALEP